MIYLDSAATTQPFGDYRLPHGMHLLGNPSSRTHRVGIQTRNHIERSREALAELIGVPVGGVVFTSGASESASILIERLSATKKLVADNKSHSCVHRYRLNSPKGGSASWFLGIAVNNETGIVEDYSAQVWDVTQAVCKVDMAIWNGAKFIFGSVHKFHGPVGLGFIAAQQIDDLELLQLPTSHGQERGIRPGTLNSPAIIQTGELAKWMLKNGDEYRAKLKHLQSTFENKIKSLTDCWIIGADQERAPHITSLNLPGVDNEALIAAVNDRLAIASGSACTSERVEPSHVLMAMFNDREIADTTVRISYGWFNTEAEVLEAAEIIAKAAETIRSFSL